ncbi:molybdenum cofactor biosynthesis protein B [Hahella sp. SMD15-11]|uniref:Molybdenum cofactor biosynthesis protein B n=1 Tax=Thermohahella caldifontis TaxID=3142973 RepID=A0AB39UZL0_9GAMM
MGHKSQAEFKPLNIAVLTVSDTRGLAEDTSGDALVEGLQEAGHVLADRVIIPDDVYLLRREVSRWIAEPTVHVVLITGGTGFTDRDSTPEAIRPLFDKEIEGFGELFRQISHTEIGSSTIQSRAVAGLANKTVIFCMPGSTGACRTAWNGIIREQLDARHKPCNFAGLLLQKKAPEKAPISAKPECGSRG